MWRLHPSVLTAAIWALAATIVVRRRLRSQGLAATSPRAPRLPPLAGRGVAGVLQRLDPTCLEKALVHQSWEAGQGRLRDVVIGVPASGFGDTPGHAWVDGNDLVSPQTYVEMHRIPARSPRARAAAEHHESRGR